MSSIKLKFKVSSSAEYGTLYIQVTHRREARQVKTRYTIHPNEWDRSNNCIIPAPNADVSRKNELSLIREKIQEHENILREILEFLEERGEPFTVNDIVIRYRAALSNKVTVFDYFTKQIFRLKKLGKNRTAECYSACANSFKKFRNNNDLYFDMLDSDIIQQYESYLRSNDLCRNSTSFYIRNLRSIYNKAVSEGFAMNSNIFRKVYTGVDKTVKRAISMEEIKKLKNIDLSDNKHLDFARDIFMFSFYTRGMSFIDMAYLRKKDIINGYLTYCRKKTGQQLSIKWKVEMQEIVDKYDTSETQYLLPIICKENGKEWAQYHNKMLIVNMMLKKLAVKTKIDANLTTYVARHSWASIAHENNIPTSVISKGMGHNSEATTKIYLASINNSKIDDANDEILNSL